jgi:CubicO group peptidase (beta-lactamase class C family)
MALLLAAVSPAQVVAAKQTVTASNRLSVLDGIAQAAIRDEQIPGAVVLIGHDGQVVYRKAFGERSLEPRREPMTVDASTSR